MPVFPSFYPWQSQAMRGKNAKLRPCHYRYCPKAKLHVGQAAQLFEFPQHVAVLVLEPKADTLSMPIHHTHAHVHMHTRTRTHTHSAGPDGMPYH